MLLKRIMTQVTGNKMMTKQEIDDIVCQIMTIDGPDGHVDGHNVITGFIVALQEGNENKWKAKYWSENNISDGELAL
jgi:hypothetical protein